jgi:hypothetical protein
MDFLSVLLGSRALGWRVPGTILGVLACLTMLYLVVKPSHVGVDVDG